ncbi:MAG: ABC transporter permease subunit [Alphaproteobacteria bacterium]|nr:ABC transporter permease subunit [Alphaproteobacteria bacterium]
MDELAQAARLALRLITEFDSALVDIIARSLLVTASATVLAAALGLPLGALLALARFPGRQMLLVTVHALMALPPVVLGLLVYLVLSRAGPLGFLGLLYTPTAMIIAQTLLILPILAALASQQIEELAREYGELLRSLGAGPWHAAATLLWEGRFALATALLTGFGRAAGEVGAVMIVGGNIDRATRVMTTAIALETGRGQLALALALGLVLIALGVGVTVATFGLRALARRLSAA